MGSRWFIPLTIVILILFSAAALADSDINVTSIKNQIVVKEKAEFSLQITNGADEKQTYSIYSLQTGQGWNVETYPLSDKLFDINPGKSYTTKIIAQPTDSFPPGIYNIPISIESDRGEKYTQQLKIYLSPEKPYDYLPSIKVDIDMDEKINPKETASIKLFLDNRNQLNLTDLKIRIESDIPEFNKEVMVDLLPLDKKTVEFSVNLNPYQQPKKYILFFVFEKKGEIVKILEKKIEIVSLLPEFTTSVKEERIFLKYFRQLTIKNEGNVLNTQEVKVPASFIEGLFSSLGKGEVKKIDGERYLVWEVALEPNASTTIDYLINYRILVYILIALLIFAGFYWYVQSPIVLTKKAMTTKSDEEGALSEIKVTLEVKNRSKKQLKDITITDIVPGIANIEKSLELGTLKPKEIRHGKQGTSVIWSLAELEAYEHRLITYKVKAKLNIIGTFSLPRATGEYAKKGNKKGKAYSNLFRLNG